jgi:hypothetical protein
MRLAQLRHQMLIAMGLPACWTQAPSSAPKRSEPPPVYAAPKRVEPEIAMFDVRSCEVDTIVETLCGRGAGEYCGPNAGTVDLANMVEGLYVTPFDDARKVANGFILDDRASEAYVTRLQSLNEKLDGKPGCCFSRCTPLVVGAAKPVPSPMPSYQMRNELCIPQPPKGTTLPDANNASCPQGVQIQGEMRPYTSTRNDQCCYASLQRRVIIQKGRPARVDGDPKFAALGEGTAWHAVIPAVEIDAALADKWLEAARMEHASIAAFCTTALRLMSFGAPPDLIAAAHRAAIEETQHAQIAFALASAYAGRAISPVQFAAATTVTPMDLRAFAIETFVDGCVGETVAALEASREAEAQPALSDIFQKIAGDEARHAALAWQIVAWCVKQDPSILDELQVENAPAEVMREVVRPCLAALAA